MSTSAFRAKRNARIVRLDEQWQFMRFVKEQNRYLCVSFEPSSTQSNLNALSSVVASAFASVSPLASVAAPKPLLLAELFAP
jgi:hypothetical protein